MGTRGQGHWHRDTTMGMETLARGHRHGHGDRDTSRAWGHQHKDMGTQPRGHCHGHEDTGTGTPGWPWRHPCGDGDTGTGTLAWGQTLPNSAWDWSGRSLPTQNPGILEQHISRIQSNQGSHPAQSHLSPRETPSHPKFGDFGAGHLQKPDPIKGLVLPRVTTALGKGHSHPKSQILGQDISRT